MEINKMAETLWNRNAKTFYLLIGASLLLFSFLGARDIWTQEHRWADIVTAMFARQDFLHPFLNNAHYYDKPLLSYWLIVISAKVFGALNTWTLRLPSALAGLIALASIYQIGTLLKGKKVGYLAAWLMLTTYYFVFWSRVASADMLNLAGTLLALAWYLSKKNKATVFDYSVFFLILAVTSLCKGLIGAIVPLIAVGVDLCLDRSFKKHLKFSTLLSILPALIVYLSPFIASTLITIGNYHENGLYLVYRENFLRYFQPFDHRDPIYTYFVYLPIYLLPWTVLFIPALYTYFTKRKFSHPWIILTLAAIFLFFTFSGSRRSYYVLPMVPFAILFIAEWILKDGTTSKLFRMTRALLGISFLFLFIFSIALPTWFYTEYGVSKFSQLLDQAISQKWPNQPIDIVMLDAENKVNFYLRKEDKIIWNERPAYNREHSVGVVLSKHWPQLLAPADHTVYVSRKLYATQLQPYFKNYTMIELPVCHWPVICTKQGNNPIAFVPG
ncbi:MAG: glycosyltransferase family 39 protein [Gammaproteobacteria bacterium]|nr:glycosyltransferase family 39 protein [Gammaproteobacteria bacterium]